MSPLHVALDALRSVRVRPEDLDLPTPCAEYDVRGLLTHVVGWQWVFADRLTGRGRGGDPTHRLGHPAADLSASSAALLAALATAPPDVELPYRGRTPVPTLVAELVAETVLHGWDLATALGTSITLDDAVLATAGEGLTLLRGEVFGESAFAPPKAAGTGLAGLVARSGRDPAWSP
ncbi:maleylpyruvate isomerase family mycothiol-dependent enzyme [Pseudonocardia pini]|uniref:maleylpyruvate isomerase family mycothiol-dependent enzyme n=1 Tax=Pseudonocardia pini TaxID=2758030 RepID=UPI0015F02D99|nr:maleylpyruvate isomerase family mycothiol-dependent enzyme [Pseudonocardia pini]